MNHTTYTNLTREKIIWNESWRLLDKDQLSDLHDYISFLVQSNLLHNLVPSFYFHVLLFINLSLIWVLLKYCCCNVKTPINQISLMGQFIKIILFFFFQRDIHGRPFTTTRTFYKGNFQCFRNHSLCTVDYMYWNFLYFIFFAFY